MLSGAPTGGLLDAPRAAQHILSAIKHGRADLLTSAVFGCLPEAAGTRLGSTLTHWSFAGFTFIAAKSAVGVGVVAAVAGPAAPVLVGIGTGTLAAASTVRNAFTGGAGSAVRRTLGGGNAEARFMAAYGFPISELLREHTPIAAAFCDLREGDGVLEFVLKARGRSWTADASADAPTTRKLLWVVLRRLGGSPSEAQARLHAALLRAAIARALKPTAPVFEPAWQCWHVIDAEAAAGAPTIDGAAVELCGGEGGGEGGGGRLHASAAGDGGGGGGRGVFALTSRASPTLAPSPASCAAAHASDDAAAVEAEARAFEAMQRQLDAAPPTYTPARGAQGSLSAAGRSSRGCDGPASGGDAVPTPASPPAGVSGSSARVSVRLAVAAARDGPCVSVDLEVKPRAPSATFVPTALTALTAPTAPATSVRSARAESFGGGEGGSSSAAGAAVAGVAAATGFLLGGPPGAILALGAAAVSHTRGVKGARSQREAQLEERVAGTAWRTLLETFEELLDLDPAGERWTLRGGGGALREPCRACLRDLTHPLGQMRHNLLRIFEARRVDGTDSAQTISDVHVTLDVLHVCALRLCSAVVAPSVAPRAGWWRGGGAADGGGGAGGASTEPGAARASVRLARQAVFLAVEDEVFPRRRGALLGGARPPSLYDRAFAATCAGCAAADEQFVAQRAQWRPRLAAHGPAALGAPPLEYAAATQQLAELQETQLPAQKVACICAAVRAVSTPDACADLLLPALIYALMMSDVRTPHAECRFVLEFVHEETDLAGATGYALTTFQAAIQGCALYTL